MCANIRKPRFSKIAPEGDSLFKVFGHVPGCLFENVRVLPYVCICLQESIANMCANIGKTRFSKIPPEGDALFMFWNVFPVVCSRMFV